MESSARGVLGSGRGRLLLAIRFGLSAPRRNELGTAWRYRLAWEGKSAMTRASSPAREARALPRCEFSRDGRYTSPRYTDYSLEMVAVVPSVLVKLTVNFSL